MAMTPRGWSISALAVELGRDRRTVAAAVAGLTPMGREGKADVYRLAEVLEVLHGQGKPADFEAARTRKMAAEAELAEAELARVRSTQVPIADTVAVVGEICGAIRAKCLAVPSKVTPMLVADGTPTGIQALLDRAMREVLNELVADAAVIAAGGELSDDGGDAETAAGADRERVGGLLSQAFL